MPFDRKRIAALVSGFGWHVQDLRRASLQLGIAFDAYRFDGLSGSVGTEVRAIQAGGRNLQEADGILVRMMPPGSLEQVIYRMDSLHLLERSGVPVLNPPRSVEISVDKYLSLSLLERAGLAVPPTIVCESANEALAAFENLGGDVVVKPLFGSEGRGLVRVSDFELARRTFFTLERLAAVLYVQKAVRHPGHDFRAFVLGGEVIGAIRRHAPSGDWRTNVAVGGRAEPCRLTSHMEKLAIASAEAVGAVMAGVDCLPDLDRDEPVVLEVNAVPGWRALSGATGVDVAAAILTHLKER